MAGSKLFFKLLPAIRIEIYVSYDRAGNIIV